MSDVEENVSAVDDVEETGSAENEDNTTVKRKRDEGQEVSPPTPDDTTKKTRTYSIDQTATEKEIQGGETFDEPDTKAATASYSEDRKPAPVQSPSTNSTAAAPASSGAPLISIIQTGETVIMELHPDKVGAVIGSKGAIIQEIQNRSGAKAFVNQDFPPGVYRQVTLNGTAAQTTLASDLIKMVVEQGPAALHSSATPVVIGGASSITTVIDCPQNHVAKIIGAGGSTIKDIQARTGARVQIEQNFPEGVPRKVNITGSPVNVAAAVQLVQTIIATGSLAAAGLGGGGGGGMGNHMLGLYGGGQQGGYQNQAFMGGMGGMGMYGQQQQPVGGMMGMGNAYGGGMPAMGSVGMGEAKQTVEMPRPLVGKLIGKGGETIKVIQQRSGARILVDQQVPEGFPCKVNISGTPQALSVAVGLVQEILMGVHADKLGQGLAGMGMGGAGMQPGFGMPNAQAQYGGGNGAYGMQAMNPQQQQQYGYGFQQQQMQQQPGFQQNPAMQQQYGVAAGGFNQYGAAGANGAGARGGYGAQQAAAPAAPPKAATATWSEYKTDDGSSYWYNSSTGVSQWERPSGY